MDVYGALVDVRLVNIGSRPVEIIPQTEELSEARWASADEIRGLIAEEKFACNVLFV